MQDVITYTYTKTCFQQQNIYIHSGYSWNNWNIDICVFGTEN